MVNVRVAWLFSIDCILMSWLVRRIVFYDGYADGG